MPSLSIPLCAALLSFAPAESPAVQRPSVAPTDARAGEAAIAPAQIDSEAAATGAPAPDVVEPAPAPDVVEPAPSEGLPSYDSAPADPPAPAVVEAAPGVVEPAPSEGLPSYDSAPTRPASDEGELPTDEWGVPIAPVDNSPAKGGGFYVGAGALFGAMITKQLAMGLICSDVYCGYRGNFDRIMAFGTIGLSAGGGWFDGRRAAYFGLKDETAQANLTKRRALGWTLFSVGIAGLLTDMVLTHVCYDGAAGPYRQLEGFSYTCSSVASVVTMDFSTIFAAVGIGIGMKAESERRHRARNKFDLSVAPFGGRGQAGVSFAGRF